MKKQASAVEPVVNDGSTSAAAEKEKVDERGKGGKGDAKKGKDKGDKKVLNCAMHLIIYVLFYISRVVLLCKKPTVLKRWIGHHLSNHL